MDDHLYIVRVKIKDAPVLYSQKMYWNEAQRFCADLLNNGALLVEETVIVNLTTGEEL